MRIHVAERELERHSKLTANELLGKENREYSAHLSQYHESMTSIVTDNEKYIAKVSSIKNEKQMIQEKIKDQNAEFCRKFEIEKKRLAEIS